MAESLHDPHEGEALFLGQAPGQLVFDIDEMDLECFIQLRPALISDDHPMDSTVGGARLTVYQPFGRQAIDQARHSPRRECDLFGQLPHCHVSAGTGDPKERLERALADAGLQSQRTVEGLIQPGEGLEAHPERVNTEIILFDHGIYLTFRSTSVAQEGSSYRLTGDLTIKDVAKPIVLDVEYLGINVDPWGNEKVAFAATGTFNRDDWGLNWNVALEAGGWLVSKQFDIEIVMQAARA